MWETFRETVTTIAEITAIILGWLEILARLKEPKDKD